MICKTNAEWTLHHLICSFALDFIQSIFNKTHAENGIGQGISLELENASLKGKAPSRFGKIWLICNNMHSV